MIEVRTETFGVTKDGEEVRRYILSNSKGMCVKLINYGCAVQGLSLFDKRGQRQDVVLGYDKLEGYEEGSCFHGALVGRYANRIKGAGFTLNGKDYRLPENDGKNHLHGVWSKKVYPGNLAGDTVAFSIVSPDGEEGYPGRVQALVSYSLTEDNELIIEYTAKTDKDTVINLTNHSYFNLNGQDGSTILSHKVELNSRAFTEGDKETLPTGRILSVGDTPMDFRREKEVGSEIFADDEQIRFASGYDHNFILHEGRVGKVRSDKSGICMEIFTSQPGVQFYTGNHLAGDRAANGKNGIRYPAYGGLCLETQHYPASPNFPDFPTTVLKAGENYRERTMYRFGLEV